MIFEILEESNDTDTIVAIIDNHTFNQIIKMLVVEAYHKGINEKEDKTLEENKDE